MKDDLQGAALRRYRLVAAIIVAIVVGLFVWQPWNANGSLGNH